MLNITVKGIPVVVLVLPLLLLGYFFIPQSPKPSIIGIDLGTTFSSVAAYPPKSGEVQLFEVDDKNKLSVPSIVTFISDLPCIPSQLIECDVEYGRKLIFNPKIDPKRTFYDSKRFIGKKYDPSDPQAIADLTKIASHYPFDLALNSTDGSILFILPPAGAHKSHDGTTAHPDLLAKVPSLHQTDSFNLPQGWSYVHPETISALVLLHMKKSAEKIIGRKIEEAVISVPAEFDVSQRNATVYAASLAGLKVPKLLSEPTAAALAYGLHKKAHRALVIVVDFGGGTMDVSLLERDKSMFYVVGIAGNNRLGGQDVTEEFMQWAANQKLPIACSHLWGNIEKWESVDVSTLLDTENLQDFRQKIDDAKVALAYKESVNIEMNIESSALGAPCNALFSITRIEFETAVDHVLAKIIQPIEAVLSSAQVTPSEIEEVVLVGGSTLIPKVRILLRTFFGQSEMKIDIDPELAVVTGAAVQAGVTSNSWPIKVSALELPRDDLKKIECGETQMCSNNKAMDSVDESIKEKSNPITNDEL